MHHTKLYLRLISDKDQWSASPVTFSYRCSCLLAHTTVIDALERMSEFSVSSIAVVIGENALLGNISMADVRVFQGY